MDLPLLKTISQILNRFQKSRYIAVNTTLEYFCAPQHIVFATKIKKCRIETIFRTFHLRYWPRTNSRYVQLIQNVDYRFSTSNRSSPVVPEGGFAPTHAERVEAMSTGCTRRLICWAATPAPANMMGT